MTDSTPDEQPEPQRFLTLRQASKELNTKESTIRGLIQSGELPAPQVGGHGQWRIERTKLEEYIADAYTKSRAVVLRGQPRSG